MREAVRRSLLGDVGLERERTEKGKFDNPDLHSALQFIIDSHIRFSLFIVITGPL